MTDPKLSDEAFRKAAKDMLEVEGVLEIDDTAEVSRNDDAASGGDGAYVQAWVWVPNEAVKAE